MISAILYKSATGSCERYAHIMSRKLALPSYPVDACPLPNGMKVIFIGWLMNGKVQGLAKAQKNYAVKAVVPVGMSLPTGAALEAYKEKNGLDSTTPVFGVQGAFHMDRLSFPMRLIMKKVNQSIVKRLEGKGRLSDAEQATLTMAETGDGEPATWDGIDAAVEWALQQRDPLNVMKWYEPQ